MITLNYLKSIGCISSDYFEVDYHSNNSVSITELLSWSQSKQEQFTGVVLCDNCLWAATLKRLPLAKANKIYSSDGESLCCWDSEKRTVFIKSLIDKKLVTVRQYILPKIKKEKEIRKMADINIDGLDLNEMTNFSDESVVAGPATGKGSREESERSRDNRRYIEKMQNADISVQENTAIITENQSKGRSLGFITRTDKAVRMSLVKVAKKGPDGRVILNEEGSKNPDVVKKYEDYKAGKENSTMPAKKYLEVEYDFKFKEAKPGKIVAMIIKIPASTADINYANFLNSEVALSSTSSTETVVRILPIEQAYDYLITAFDGKIKEDEALLGARAAWLQIKGVIAKPTGKNAAVEGDNVRLSLILAAKSETRKTLLTEGNYIPMKVYKALSQNDIKSAEDAEKLNNNVKQLFKDSDKAANLTEAAKSIFDADNLTVKYFAQANSERQTIEAPDRFDGNGKVANVKIALRDSKVSKTSGKNTYPYIYEDDFSAIVKSNRSVAAIMEAANVTAEDLAAEFKKLSKTTSRTSGSKNITSLDIDTLKKSVKAKGAKSTKDLAALLAGIA